MKFYLVQSSAGDNEGCFTNRDDAMWHLSNHHQTVQMIDVPVNAETIRRLLGEEGGYVKSSKQIYPEKDDRK
jgi:hypothetical protein